MSDFVTRPASPPGRAGRRCPPGLGKAARPLNVGAYIYPTAITLAGQTSVVLEPYGCAVVVINLTTRRVYAPITVGGYPTAVAITA